MCPRISLPLGGGFYRNYGGKFIYTYMNLFLKHLIFIMDSVQKFSLYFLLRLSHYFEMNNFDAENVTDVVKFWDFVFNFINLDGSKFEIVKSFLFLPALFICYHFPFCTTCVSFLFFYGWRSFSLLFLSLDLIQSGCVCMCVVTILKVFTFMLCLALHCSKAEVRERKRERKKENHFRLKVLGKRNDDFLGMLKSI